MPSYGGFNIFGYAVSMNTVKRESARQTNDFFGVEGVEEIHGGGRGWVTRVRGVLFGISPFDLAVQETTFASLDDGNARDLVDMLGTTWTDVKLGSFESQGEVKQTPQGTFFRPYIATFNHLY